MDDYNNNYQNDDINDLEKLDGLNSTDNNPIEIKEPIDEKIVEEARQNQMPPVQTQPQPAQAQPQPVQAQPQPVQAQPTANYQVPPYPNNTNYQYQNYNVNQGPVQNTNPYQNPYQSPYQQPYQNPYTNMGPNQNTQNNPYGQAANPYQNPQPQIRYNAYQGKYEQVQKERLKPGVIILISVISVLLVAFIVAFFSLQASIKTDKKENSYFATDDPNSIPFFFGDGDDFNFGQQNNYQYKNDSVEIELQEDKGNTQEKEGNLEGAKPDSDFKDLTVNDIPKDAKTGNYSSETAYQKVSPAVVAVQCFKDKITEEKTDILGEGTGTVISKDGYIITNSHVIGDSRQYKINIVFNDKSSKEAKVVGYDSRTDIAILKVDADNLQFVELGNSDKVNVGEDVIAIGNPGGQSFQNSLTKGIVSFVGREISINDLVKYIQIDASINPGNSGGPLCNIYGQVIGINTAKISSTEYEGMGFAIPTNTVVEITNDLIHYGYVKNRVMIGISGTEVSSQQISYGMPAGILVSQIVDGGPLSGKIKEDDIITKIDGVEVSTFQNVYAQLAKHKPGDKITIEYARPQK